MIKWLWGMIVGRFCYPRRCQWEQVRHNLMGRDVHGDHITDEYILRCKVCGDMKVFRA